MSTLAIFPFPSEMKCDHILIFLVNRGLSILENETFILPNMPLVTWKTKKNYLFIFGQ